jgi:hypothetical protein
MLVKFLIEREAKRNVEADSKKVVIILLHIRYVDQRLEGFNSFFSQEWTYFHIDDVDQSEDEWENTLREGI